MALKPLKLLKIQQSILQSNENWNEAEEGDIFTGYPYRWQIQLNVESLIHASPSTRTPYQYDGMDIEVGNWVATSDQGIAVRIYEIVSATPTQVIVNVEDVDRYNLFSDATFSGIGIGPDGSGYVFEVDEEGYPILGPGSAYYMGITFQTDLISRFNYRNITQGYVRFEQAGHTFVQGDIIFLDSDGSYKLLAAVEANKDKLDRVVGVVSGVGIPGVNFFTVKPKGNYVNNISPALPTATPGSLIYIDPANPGKLTATKPTKYAVPVYIRLGSDTEALFLTGGAGGGAAGPLGYYASSYLKADITARDAIPLGDLNPGDLVLVDDMGDGRWGQYVLTDNDPAAVWLLIAEEALPVNPSAFVVANLAARDALAFGDLDLGDTAFVTDIGGSIWGFYTVIAKTGPSTITWQLIASQPQVNPSAFVVADITARNAIPFAQIDLGDLAYVTNIGSNLWGFYTVISKTAPSTVVWQLIAQQSPPATNGDAIISTNGKTRVDTQKSGSTDKVVVTANNKVSAEFASGTAALGEHVLVTNTVGEVQLVTKTTLGTEATDMRLVPQGAGFVFLGITGDGVVEAEATFDLQLKGGESNSTTAPGAVRMFGGSATSGNFKGGDVVIQPGAGFGSGANGIVTISDAEETPVAEFISSGSGSSNWIAIRNGSTNVDPIVNGVRIGVASASAASNVDIYLDPKNAGLVKVSDFSAYSAALNAAGNNDALVTKAFVNAIIGGDGPDVILPGVGLTDDAGVFNVNVEAITIKVDGSNNLIVGSSSTAGQVLVSSGTAGEQATWGRVNLSNSASVTGSITVATGGTGFTTYAEGDILVGNAGGSLSKLTVGAAGQVLVSDGTTLSYSLITSLSDENGVLVLDTVAVDDAVNYMTLSNSIAGTPVVLESDGTDTDVDILVAPRGAGLLIGKTGYTAAIGTDNETFVTRKFVLDSIASSDEPYLRRAVISSGWASEMNIGTVTPNLGKNVYVYRVMVTTTSPITGGGTTQAKILVGANVVAEAYESDILTAGTYVVDLPESFTSNNSQTKIQFFSSDGTTQATPSGGSLDITVFYRIR